MVLIACDLRCSKQFIVSTRRDGHQWNKVQEGTSFFTLTWRQMASSFGKWLQAVAKISGVLLQSVMTWGSAERSVAHKKVGVHFPVLPETCSMAFQRLIFCLLPWHQCKVPDGSWVYRGSWLHESQWEGHCMIYCFTLILYKNSFQDVVPQLGLHQASIHLGCFPLLVSLPLMQILYYLTLGFKVAPTAKHSTSSS